MLEELLITAEQAAHAAGDEARQWWHREGVEPREKGSRDWVTEADVAAQEEALAVIRKRHPDHAVLAEEGDAEDAGGEGVAEIPAGVVWIIDPVDGTSNFVRHLPFFSVSVAAAIDGQPAVGVIYDVLRDHVFSGARGQGARLDGRALEVGKATRLADAVVGFDSPREPDLRPRLWAIMDRLAQHCRTIRALGSAALGMAYVAAGRLDAYMHLNVQPWDVAAGALLVQEAGGVIRQMDGQDWMLGNPSLVMCNPALLASLVEEIAATPKG